MVPALREFANFINLHINDLTRIYIQLLDEIDVGYNHIAPERREIVTRKTLKVVIAACNAQGVKPLLDFFHSNGTPARWGTDVDSANPLAEVECLGHTLMPVVPNLEASKFLWQVLLELRFKLLGSAIGSLPSMLDYRMNGHSNSKYTSQSAVVQKISATGVDNSNPAKTLPALSIISLESDRPTANTLLTDLPLYNFQVDENTLVRHVEKFLREQRTLPGVIITRNKQAVSVISRRKFFEQLGQLYGVSVYLNRPIKLMVKAIGADPLHLPATCTVPEAIGRALVRPSLFVFEPIIVELDNYACRLLDIYTLLLAQSRILAGLQVELQQANNELEARIEERTAQLVKANTDLTEEIVKRRQVEEALVLARDQALNASRMKSELLAKVSHELRTPLGAILGHSEMLQEGFYGNLSKKQHEAATRIIGSTNYLTNLVNQLLDQAQFEAGRLRLTMIAFSPAQIVQDTLAKLAVMAEAKGLALIADIASDIPETLVGDEVRIKQILVNLVSNAIKFTQQGTVHVQLFQPEVGYWAMRVADTGPGIPKEAQSYIFEPFEQVDGSMTREQTGTGLGLSIVKQFVVLMDGKIELESSLGQGSVFTIIIPLQLVPEETS